MRACLPGRPFEEDLPGPFHPCLVCVAVPNLEFIEQRRALTPNRLVSFPAHWLTTLFPPSFPPCHVKSHTPACPSDLHSACAALICTPCVSRSLRSIPFGLSHLKGLCVAAQLRQCGVQMLYVATVHVHEHDVKAALFALDRAVAISCLLLQPKGFWRQPHRFALQHDVLQAYTDATPAALAAKHAAICCAPERKRNRVQRLAEIIQSGPATC